MLTPSAAVLPLVSHLPPGARVSEFAEAAMTAVQVAETQARRHQIDRHDGRYYMVYLTRDMQFDGGTLRNVQHLREAVKKGKRAFSLSERCWWFVVFSGVSKRALTHHRSGHRAWFGHS